VFGSISSERMVAFIGYSSVSQLSERGRPPHDEVVRRHLDCRI
jgi:hypothetical protein